MVALDAAGAPFAMRLGELRDELVAVEQLLTPPRHLRTCHRDLFADNLRVTADGDLCVIDWDNCGLADPGQELALVLYEFGDGGARSGSSALRRVQGMWRPGTHRGAE